MFALKKIESNKAPVIEESIHGRYAGLLFKVASKSEALDEVNTDMELLQGLMATVTFFFENICVV